MLRKTILKIIRYIRRLLGYKTLEDIIQEQERIMDELSGVPDSFMGSYVPKNYRHNKDI